MPFGLSKKASPLNIHACDTLSILSKGSSNTTKKQRTKTRRRNSTGSCLGKSRKTKASCTSSVSSSCATTSRSKSVVSKGSASKRQPPSLPPPTSVVYEMEISAISDLDKNAEKKNNSNNNNNNNNDNEDHDLFRSLERVWGSFADAIVGKPNRRRIDSTDSTCASSTTQGSTVRWGRVDVREYPVTLGDHPECSKGPPLTFDWDFVSEGSWDLEDYELRCSNASSSSLSSDGNLSRHCKVNRVDWCDRYRLLKECGFGDADLAKASKRAQRIRELRHETMEEALRQMKRNGRGRPFPKIVKKL